MLEFQFSACIYLRAQDWLPSLGHYELPYSMRICLESWHLDEETFIGPVGSVVALGASDSGHDCASSRPAVYACLLQRQRCQTQLLRTLRTRGVRYMYIFA